METLNIRSVAEEHAALRATSGAILALLDGMRCACGEVACARCIQTEMKTFSRRLQAHFDEEESSWKDADWARREAAMRAWIDGLLAEHRDFRTRLAEACSALEEARIVGRSVEGELKAGIRSILAELAEHELSEVRLFQRSVVEGWAHVG